MTTGKSTRTSPPTQVSNGLRFVFYGRTSTVRHQDRVSSQGWQRDMADNLITGHGQIVATYFDADTSRRVPWAQRQYGPAPSTDSTAAAFCTIPAKGIEPLLRSLRRESADNLRGCHLEDELGQLVFEALLAADIVTHLERFRPTLCLLSGQRAGQVAPKHACCVSTSQVDQFDVAVPLVPSENGDRISDGPPALHQVAERVHSLFLGRGVLVHLGILSLMWAMEPSSSLVVFVYPTVEPHSATTFV